MNRSRLIRPILLLGGVWALGALGLRWITLTRSINQEGLVRIGSPALAVTMLLSALGMGLLTVLCLRLNRLPGTEACFRGGAGLLTVQLAAPVLLLAGCLLCLVAPAEEGNETLRIGELVGVGMAFLMFGTRWIRPGKGRFWPRLLPALWALAMMILRFRSWTQDPLIIRIAPTLMAVLCSLICLALLAGFPLGAGHRRSTVLFGLASGVFTLMAAPDQLTGFYGSVGELLMLLGPAVWNVTHALALLRPAVQEEVPPAAEDEKQPDAEETAT